MRLTPRNIFWLLRRSVIGALDDNCFGIAKAAAYSALLAFFPVLASAATILLETRAGFFSGMLERSLSEIVPPGTEDLVLQQFRVSGSRPIAVLIVAAVVSIFAASGVIKSLIEGFQAAYRVPRNRSVVHNSLIGMALVLLAAAPLLAASLLILFGGQVEHKVMEWMRVDPLWTPLAWVWQLLSRLMQYVVAFATVASVSATLYYFGPYRQQRWRYVWPGAILATLLWLAATSGFAWYAVHIAHYNVMYGSVGASIALLVWMYVLAIVALIGCEFNAEYERASAVR
ncbi:MAG TPA: YihY/virulence factor BrkB family protein [Bryobacteraceae bacterium]|jgi:membrane protein|nr:YihY/virulence factor BrkB family protein [Bryobacteraceae bacterium]